jgi:hypothetical protein
MSPWTYRLSVATACATFVRLFIGGMTPRDALPGEKAVAA